MMFLGEKGRHSRRLRVAPHASIDRVSSSSRELLAVKASEVESAEASLVGTLSVTPAQRGRTRRRNRVFAALRSLWGLIPTPLIACRTWLPLPAGPSDNSLLGNNVIGTIFGYRKGHVYFAVQVDPRAEPILLLELATPTNSLVKEMASGLVRIALECERTQRRGKLFLEPVWTMYCNGRKTGYAIRRSCSETDLEVLTLVQAISMGAGVLPKTEEEHSEGELMYMRAKFERVVGSKDSEALYMMNPDGTGGPELSIFLLRI